MPRVPLPYNKLNDSFGLPAFYTSEIEEEGALTLGAEWSEHITD